jgi:hypothetical protein
MNIVEITPCQGKKCRCTVCAFASLPVGGSGEEWLGRFKRYVPYLRMAIEEARVITPIGKEASRTEWGDWRLALTSPFSLDYNHGYEITLDRLNSWAKVAHWASHLHEKAWFNPEYTADNGGDRESALNFFRAIVSLTRRGLL